MWKQETVKKIECNKKEVKCVIKLTAIASQWPLKRHFFFPSTLCQTSQGDWTKDASENPVVSLHPQLSDSWFPLVGVWEYGVSQVRGCLRNPHLGACHSEDTGKLQEQKSHETLTLTSSASCQGSTNTRCQKHPEVVGWNDEKNWESKLGFLLTSSHRASLACREKKFLNWTKGWKCHVSWAGSCNNWECTSASKMGFIHIFKVAGKQWVSWQEYIYGKEEYIYCQGSLSKGHCSKMPFGGSEKQKNNEKNHTHQWNHCETFPLSCLKITFYCIEKTHLKIMHETTPIFYKDFQNRILKLCFVWGQDRACFLQDSDPFPIGMESSISKWSTIYAA